MDDLPDIEAEGERIANETWRHPSGMYLWTDLVGAIQTAIVEERERHFLFTQANGIRNRLRYDTPYGTGKFELLDPEPDNHHSALYLVDPTGAAFNISSWDEEGVDIARGKWMVAVLNAALSTSSERIFKMGEGAK